MEKFFKWFFWGPLIGAGVGLALYVLGFILELANCFCGIIACDLTRSSVNPKMWSEQSFWKVMIFCTLGGWIIGSIYGMVLSIQERNARLAAEQAERDKRLAAEQAERDRKALEQRQKNASILKSKIDNILESANRIQKNSNNHALTPDYSSCEKQKKAWECLNTAIDSNEKLRVIIDDLDYSGSNKGV